MKICEVTAPINLTTGGNSRLHRMVSYKHNKMQSWVIAGLLHGDVPSNFKMTPETRLAVTLTRIAPARGRWRMDDDNLESVFKNVRDSVAKHFKLDDGNARWQWNYAQEAGQDYAIRILVETTP